jgi:hypothetical membrane protein
MSGALAYLILEAIAAASFRPRYSYTHNLISELGSTSWVMTVAFYLQGTLFLIGAMLIGRAAETGRAALFLDLAAANAVGNYLIAAFHSGPVHGTGAFLAIVGGNAAILAGSAIVSGVGWYRRVSVGLGVLGLLSFALFVIELNVPAMGVLAPAVWERCSVYSITGWQLVSAILCYTRSR